MLRHTKRSPRRAGFTLVEMLVAAGVSILLMVIVTGAFTQGLDMFRRLRAQSKLQDTIRQASTTIKDDLSWNHFQLPSSGGYGDDNAYLRGQDLTKADFGGWSPPPAGFFRISQFPEDANGNPFQFDGTESFGFPFARSVGHALHFTVQRPANGPDQMLRTLDPGPYAVAGGGNFPRDFIDPTDYREAAGNAFITRWAEVAYFLVRDPSGDLAGGVTPLYHLYRAQKLLLPLPQLPSSPPNSASGGQTSATVTVGTNGTPANGQYNQEMSRRYLLTGPANVAIPKIPPPNPNTEVYNRPGDVTQPRNRWGMMPSYDNPDPTQNAAYANLAGLFVQPLGRYPLMADAAPYFGVGPNDLRANNDLLLTNVISFEVKAIWSAPANGPFPQASYKVPDGGGGSITIPNADYPFDYIPLSSSNQLFSSNGVRVFDTWSNAGPPTGSPPNTGPPYGAPDNSPGAVAAGVAGKPYWQQTYNPGNPIATAARLPLRIRIRALQIRIRVWDPKTEQTRQMTIVEDV